MKKAVLFLSYILLHVSSGFAPLQIDQKLHQLHVSTSSQSDVLVATKTIEEQENTTFRRMKEADVPEIVRLYVREYGAANPQRPFTLFPPLLHGIVALKFCDNFVLACILYLALYQRLARRFITETDHQVWVLCNDEHVVVGAAELSLEVRERSALPIALPVSFKKRLFGATHVLPYISNVIVKESHRGRGYGTVLLQELEQRARHQYHQEQLTLHVNEDATAAKSLYQKLGYTAVGTKPDDAMGRLFRFVAGLYFVPESKQLYMKKELTKVH